MSSELRSVAKHTLGALAKEDSSPKIDASPHLLLSTTSVEDLVPSSNSHSLDPRGLGANPSYVGVEEVTGSSQGQTQRDKYLHSHSH